MISNIKELIGEANSIAIGGHTHPDGDCTGSTLGLYQYLKTYYKERQVDLYLEEVPRAMRTLSGVDEIKHEAPEEAVYDLFICLDCGDADRLGFSKELFERAKATACIDHHVSNQAFADKNLIVPDASSTSELVFTLLSYVRITEEIATCLYMGIVHDTGCFRYAGTSPRTMEIGASLLRKGIDAPKIIDQTYYEKSFAAQKMLGIVLQKSKRFFSGRCIAGDITIEEMEEYQASYQDLDSIVPVLRETADVEVAFFMYQLGERKFKVSLRSKDYVDVSKICVSLQGGGHIRAAGATVEGTREEVQEKVLEMIRQELLGEGCHD